MFKTILVVCSGNICRSPIGEGLLRDRLRGKVTVSSAGCTALVGHPADPLAVEVAAEHNCDISAHRARQIDTELLAGLLAYRAVYYIAPLALAALGFVFVEALARRCPLRA